ncbi:MAG: MFS transporter [Dehalococcoidia bacterium]
MPRDLAAAARRNERLFYAFSFLMEFGFWMAIWIKYLTVIRHFELRFIFLMDMPFWLMVAALEAPFGALADRIGHSRVLAIGAAVYALTIAGFGFTTNYWMLFADYMLWAVAMACRSGADQALLYDSFKQGGVESRFSKAVGRGFATSITAATTGIILGGFLATFTSLAFTVQISFVGPLIAMVVALSMIEPHVEHDRPGYLDNLKRGFSFAWRTPQVRFTVLLGSTVMMAAFAPVILIQPFLIQHDVRTGLFGVLQAPLQVAAVLAAILAHRIAARVGTPGMFAFACAAMVIAFLGLSTIDHVGIFFLFAVPAITRGMMRPTIDTYLNQHTPSETRATVLSVASLVMSAQVAFFEPVIGFITDDISLQAAFAFVAIYFGVMFPPLYLLWRRAYVPAPEFPLAEAAAVA